MGKLSTTKEFIIKAEKVHNKKYNYESVIYINSTTKINILCYKHGYFMQTPSSHLGERGCRECQYDEMRSHNNTSNNSHIVCVTCNINKPVSEYNYRKDCMSYRKDCKECQYKRQKLHRIKNIDKIKIRDKQYRLNNIISVSSREKKYRKENRDVINRNVRRRTKEDALFKLKSNIRTAIRRGFRRNNHKKTCKTVDILGCSFEEFKSHIESQFEPWMNWGNHGQYSLTRTTWQLDHITPISLAQTKEDVIKLSHYTNFQPLESLKNLRKGNKF